LSDYLCPWRRNRDPRNGRFLRLRTDVAPSLMHADHLIDDCFRHEYGRIVAGPARRYGMGRLDLIEDAVQDAMMAAVDTWGRGGMPQVPGAWLRRVAQNKLIDALRHRRPESPLPTIEPATNAAVPGPPLSREIASDELRMLFVCCDDQLPIETQLVLALKLLCGFTVEEIALRLFVTSATVYKRVSRGPVHTPRPGSGLGWRHGRHAIGSRRHRATCDLSGLQRRICLVQG
jgi:RNA polymerase sigma factor (sigma-70 family)